MAMLACAVTAAALGACGGDSGSADGAGASDAAASAPSLPGFSASGAAATVEKATFAGVKSGQVETSSQIDYDTREEEANSQLTGSFVRNRGRLTVEGTFTAQGNSHGHPLRVEASVRGSVPRALAGCASSPIGLTVGRLVERPERKPEFEIGEKKFLVSAGLQETPAALDTLNSLLAEWSCGHRARLALLGLAEVRRAAHEPDGAARTGEVEMMVGSDHLIHHLRVYAVLEPKRPRPEEIEVSFEANVTELNEADLGLTPSKRRLRVESRSTEGTTQRSLASEAVPLGGMLEAVSPPPP